MRVLVCGAGIQGSFLAAKLYEAGIDARLLARGERLRRILEDGIRLSFYPSEDVRATRVPVVSETSESAPYDIVFVTMQKQQAIELTPRLSELGPDTTFVYLGNNGTGTQDYETYIDRDCLILGFLETSGHRVDDHIEIIAAEPSRAYLGTVTEDVKARFEKTSSLLSAAGFRVEVESNMDAWLKCHLAMILPVAGAVYAAGTDTHRLARTPGLIRMTKRAIGESLSVLRCLNYPLVPKGIVRMAALPEWLLIRIFGKRMDTREAEIALAGHARAARAEISHLAREFGLLVKQSGRSTPHLDFLLGFLDPSKPAIEEGSDFKTPPS